LAAIIEGVPRPEILTIGHSTHTLADFVALLERHRAKALADVRLAPGSRRLPHFGRAPLASALGAAGVQYAHFAELGGRRRPAADSPNAGWENAAFRGYADHMQTPEFASGLARLETLARGRRTAVMCAEGLWWRCHRRLLADALLMRGWRVLHVATNGALSEHELTSFAVADGERLTYPPPQPQLPRG
jgi:uncharacterized protein (DUF488 family)